MKNEINISAVLVHANVSFLHKRLGLAAISTTFTFTTTTTTPCPGV